MCANRTPGSGSVEEKRGGSQRSKRGALALLESVGKEEGKRVPAQRLDRRRAEGRKAQRLAKRRAREEDKMKEEGWGQTTTKNRTPGSGKRIEIIIKGGAKREDTVLNLCVN